MGVGGVEEDLLTWTGPKVNRQSRRKVFGMAASNLQPLREWRYRSRTGTAEHGVVVVGCRRRRRRRSWGLVVEEEEEVGDLIWWWLVVEEEEEVGDLI
ncbi:hypothetical protein Q3G72_014977 [Acer saccharum]|nr:hypothetical protein Q3G72_014977 [Acer saccharum]